MPKKYGHIQQHEEEILRLRNEGYTRQQIADKLGMTKEQIKNSLSDITKNKEKFMPK